MYKIRVSPPHSKLSACRGPALPTAMHKGSDASRPLETARWAVVPAKPSLWQNATTHPTARRKPRCPARQDAARGEGQPSGLSDDEGIRFHAGGASRSAAIPEELHKPAVRAGSGESPVGLRPAEPSVSSKEPPTPQTTKDRLNTGLLHSEGKHHKCSRNPFKRAMVRSRPRISMDSNSGGETRRPDTATRTGPNARRGL